MSKRRREKREWRRKSALPATTAVSTPAPVVAASPPTKKRDLSYGDPSPGLAGLAFAGGRVSTDLYTNPTPGISVILPPPDADTSWSVGELDVDALDKRPTSQLLEMLSDLSPEVSNALWQWLRLCNPGWTVQALVKGSDVNEDTPTIDPVAQGALDAFLTRLHDLYGTVDVVIGRLFASTFLRGALFAELVLDLDGQTPVDLATPDPFTVRFKHRLDKVRGGVWQLCQLQYHTQGGLESGVVELTRPTISYIPIDPLPGRPYGRPMASPVLHTALFLIGMLHDLRRVISQQGYPRLDISIDLERMKANMPPEDVNDVEKWTGWARSVYRDVSAIYERLEPDDAYVHTDVVTVNRPVGTLSTDALSGVDGILAVLERMATRALKTQPILAAGGDAVSDAAGNRQWEIYSQGTKTIQHYVEVLLERLCGLALRAQGIDAVVKWRFAVVRGAERFLDEQIARQKADTARTLYDNGVISMDQQAQIATGAAKADQKAPRVQQAKGAASIPKAAIPDAGANRSGEGTNGHDRREDANTLDGYELLASAAGWTPPQRA